METLIIIIVWLPGSLFLGWAWADIFSAWSGLFTWETAIEKEHTKRLEAVEKELRYRDQQWQKLAHSREDRPYRGV